MTILLGQILFTNFTGSGFQFIVSPSVPDITEPIFREQIVDARWDLHSPPPSEWRAAYMVQLEPSKTIFGWVYHDGRDEYGRDHVPYFLAYYLNLTLDRVVLDLIIAFLGKGPGSVPSRQTLPKQLDDITAPELWSYLPQRPGVVMDSATRENAHKSLLQGRSVDLFVVAPDEPLLLEFDEQVCELLSLLLAQHMGPYARTLVGQVIEGTASVLEPKQRILQVLDRLVAELDDELGKAEFVRRAKAVLGIVGPQV
jgi:hypothetical protein